MIKTFSSDVTAANGAIAVVSAVIGIADKTRRIIGVAAEITAGVRTYGTIGQETIVDAAQDCDYFISNMVPVDHVLQVGEEFKAGVYNTSGGETTSHITVIYEEI
tara:strand:+ start:1589 stop:1903 length:315 start_codon:yes stop_codon:yes gene_type:complete